MGSRFVFWDKGRMDARPDEMSDEAARGSEQTSAASKEGPSVKGFTCKLVSQTPIRRVCLERGTVVLDELIKEGALWAMTRLQRPADTGASVPASRQRQHVRILANSSKDSA